MREHEMRQRVESVLRRMAVPAGVGITMALAGCGSDSSDGAVAVYSAMCPNCSSPDAAPDSGTVTPLYMAVMPDAGAKDSATDAADATTDEPGAVPDYIAPFPLYRAMMPDGG